MRRETLLDYFADITASDAVFLVYDDGYRTHTYRYRQVGELARRFAVRLREVGFRKGDKIILWGENRPEWVIAFWGSLLAGVIVVPVDYRTSVAFVDRVRRIVEARAAVVGEEVDASSLIDVLQVWSYADVVSFPAEMKPFEPVALEADDVAEIIFTSGATADPKGVIISHRNILADLVPIETEVRKYRAWGRPFFPLRFLNLLPLSHMFGQAMGTFIPPMLPGVTVFMRGYSPAEIVRQVRSRRISVIVCVPKILEVLREYLISLDPTLAQGGEERRSVVGRWWRYRRIHRTFGWKFWCFVVGAAPLDPDLEGFWSRLGFLVIQGYGLTETAPIVTLNHPFRARRGTVGTPIAGVEIKIAPDGEILVRGDNVTRGYYRADSETTEAFRDGWFHTGDIGELDPEGRLIVRGRKKEVIVTPEGLNVFPEDVERVLQQLPGVREAAVVGVAQDSEERVHAVLVLEPGARADELVRLANARLEEHQKIRGVSVWPHPELPRTEGTRKLKRRLIKEWVEGRPALAPPPETTSPVAAIVARFARGRPVTGATSLEELGLTSLDRVELLLALEARCETALDESLIAQARTVADLEALVAAAERLAPTGAIPPEPAAAATPVAGRPRRGGAVAEPVAYPAWSRRWPARAVRRLSLALWILPLARLFAWVHVSGREHLATLRGPVVFAANHQSHFDTPVIFLALPARWRYRLAPAMAKEFFEAHFHPERHSWRERLPNSLNYYLAALFFNAFPLPQREAGAREALRYIGELADEGWSILIYPEGRRSPTEEIGPFQPGIGMIASRARLPVVPVRLEGVSRVLHPHWRMARPGRVRVTFGAPLVLQGDDYALLARQVEAAVRALGGSQSARS